MRAGRAGDCRAPDRSSLLIMSELTLTVTLYVLPQTAKERRLFGLPLPILILLALRHRNLSEIVRLNIFIYLTITYHRPRPICPHLRLFPLGSTCPCQSALSSIPSTAAADPATPPSGSFITAIGLPCTSNTLLTLVPSKLQSSTSARGLGHGRSPSRRPVLLSIWLLRERHDSRWQVSPPGSSALLNLNRSLAKARGPAFEVIRMMLQWHSSRMRTCGNMAPFLGISSAVSVVALLRPHTPYTAHPSKRWIVTCVLLPALICRASGK
ncbi:hypothetical protein BDP81DRAFT_66527 [Colletotrichum phormii]|uniref:Uncharacterized protein n=1 Tax=Colletotrichum phormii TaxID=359342 RepID=A0AAI9ZM31_9PEZI|nr:uncharacterized protein BDP81DRAFT_66527 [Colletotrichum phormii]KAK1634170.1 hypothetical protein BDP81DRAFT_66527 [Colletotrichum phormii]